MATPVLLTFNPQITELLKPLILTPRHPQLVHETTQTCLLSASSFTEMLPPSKIMLLDIQTPHLTAMAQDKGTEQTPATAMQ